MTVLRTSLAYGVHAYTASGVVFALLAVTEIASADPDPRWVFAWLIVALVIDATDGPLARWVDVKTWARRIDGRKIDDLVDYLTFTFVPLVLAWRLHWVPWPEVAWVAPAMVASLLGFAHVAAKQEARGFFLGFPSYWNIVVFYAGLWCQVGSPWGPGLVIAVLTVLTVLPVRMLYPNLAPRRWRWPVLGGGALWLLMLAAMLPTYPCPPAWLVGVSLVYPAFYVGLSAYLDVCDRRTKA